MNGTWKSCRTEIVTTVMTLFVAFLGNEEAAGRRAARRTGAFWTKRHGAWTSEFGGRKARVISGCHGAILCARDLQLEFVDLDDHRVLGWGSWDLDDSP
jgi:hypothetical protein